MNVAFIIFNRPELTKRVFEKIAEAKPDRLFIIADGPRNDEEVKRCANTRAVVKDINWQCEVFRNYSDVNMGCRNRVSSGLDWVFDRVEDAIILEDDCLPDLSFFPFCQELLDKYRDDVRIGHISGGNACKTKYETKYSYMFSQYRFIWGWATWRRSWENFDKDMLKWKTLKKEKWHHAIFTNPEVKYFYEDMWDDILDGKLNTWGIPWFFTGLAEKSLSIIPSKNLISNIGFGLDGTHTFDKDPRINTKIKSVGFPLLHPDNIVRDIQYDKILENKLLLPYQKPLSRFKKNILNKHYYGYLLRRITVTKKLFK